ncbi:MAG TPA: fibronectin type III domain-containing protein, partial [Flavobacterium sp.]
MKTITQKSTHQLLKSAVMVFFWCIAMAGLDATSQVQLSESFETGLPPGSYVAATSYTLGSGVWTGQANGVTRATTGKVTGNYSVQLRSQTGAQITSPNIATGGVSTVTFYGSSSTATGSVQVNYSTDGGTTWTPASGSPFGLTSGTPVLKTATINSTSNNILVQFYRTASTVYIDDVTITATATPTLTTNVSSLPNFGPVNVGASSSHAIFNVSGTNLSSNVTISSNSASFVVSPDGVAYSASYTISNTGSLSSVPVYVKFTPQSSEPLSGSISVAATGATTKNVSVSGTGVAVTPYFDATDLTFAATCLGSTSTDDFLLEGFNLNSTNVAVGPSSGFTFSTSAAGPYTTSLVLTPASGSLSQQVYVRFIPVQAQPYNDGIPVSGGGVNTFTVDVTASGINTPASATTGSASAITSTSATVTGNFVENCGSVSTYGFQYATDSSFATTMAIAGLGAVSGSYFVALSSLAPNTTYYFRAYVTDGATTYYGMASDFKTLDISAPVATTATAVTTTGFTANWNAVPGAIGYRLDVSTSSTFGTATAGESLAQWTFPTSELILTPETASANNSGATLSTNAGTISSSAGASTESASSANWNLGSGTKFWQITLNTLGFSHVTVSSLQRSSNTGPRDFKVQYRIGSGTWADVAGGAVTTGNDWTSGVVTNLELPTAADNQEQVSVRWIMTSNTSVGNATVGAAGTSRIDNIVVTASAEVPSFVTGYEDVATGNQTSFVVNGLTPGTQYYYRVRAISENSVSGNSNVIEVTTGSQYPFYVDADGDTFGAGELVMVASADPNIAPEGYSLNNTDCDDTDATKFNNADLWVDQDGDGYTEGSAADICYGAEIPEGYSAATLGADCDDTDATK